MSAVPSLSAKHSPVRTVRVMGDTVLPCPEVGRGQGRLTHLQRERRGRRQVRRLSGGVARRGGPSGGPAAVFPLREVRRAGRTCRRRGLPARAGGPRHAGWALNCYTLKDFVRQMHTTINQLMKTKLRTAHSRPSTSAAAFTSPHGGPIFSTSTNHSYRHGLKVFEVYVCRSPR